MCLHWSLSLSICEERTLSLGHPEVSIIPAPSSLHISAMHAISSYGLLPLEKWGCTSITFGGVPKGHELAGVAQGPARESALQFLMVSFENPFVSLWNISSMKSGIFICEIQGNFIEEKSNAKGNGNGRAGKLSRKLATVWRGLGQRRDNYDKIGACGLPGLQELGAERRQSDMRETLSLQYCKPRGRKGKSAC